MSKEDTNLVDTNSKICKGAFLKQKLNNKCPPISIWGSTEIFSHHVLFLCITSQEHKDLFHNERPTLKLPTGKTCGEGWGTHINTTVYSFLKLYFSVT